MSDFHKVYDANHNGRDFVVGDIHGMYAQLTECLEKADFDRKIDRCFSVGDLIDRGPSSVAVLELAKEDWFIPVQGNHEQLMLGGLSERGDIRLWYANGGQWASEESDKLESLARLITDMPFVITLNHSNGLKYGICHAECPVDDWNDIDTVEGDPRKEQQLIWGRELIKRENPVPVKNIDITIHGHTPLSEIAAKGNALYIDTGCFYSENLTLLDISSIEL